MTRYLRIAAGSCFALLTIAIIGMWVRSYKSADALRYISRGSFGFRVASYQGIATFLLFDAERLLDQRGWVLRRVPADPGDNLWDDGWLGFNFGRTNFQTAISLPYYFTVLISATLAAVFAYKRIWRFTIRTLLIATTLMAGALGLGVYLL